MACSSCPSPPFVERPTDQENSATNGSIFTEWSATLPHRVVLTAGASLNKNDFAIHNLLQNGALFDTTTTQRKSFDWVLTPRVLVSKGFATSALVYASVSAGYTPPLLSNVIANTGAVDLSLKPERAVQYELGTTGAYLNDRLTTQLDVFDIENTDKLVSETSSSVTFTTNAGKQRNRGVEASAGYAFVRDTTRMLSLVRPWLSYAFTDAKFIDFKSDNNNSDATVSFSGNAVPRVPRNTFAAGLDLGTQQGFLLTSSFIHIDRVPVTFDNSTYVRGYDLLSAKVGYRHAVTRHWMLAAFAGGDNLLGSTFYSFLFVGPNIQGLATSAQGGTGDGYIIPGPYSATAYGSVSLRYVF